VIFLGDRQVQWTEPRLLIADDDVDFRESLAEAFSRRGFLTELAADGCEAVEIVQSACGLHLVLLDVHMPRLSGLEALEQIRTLAPHPLPCILMSAQLDDNIVQQAQRLNTSSVLSKPFRLRDLTGTVAEILLENYGLQM
jgi:CheY-like chemotaxis protein